MGRLISASRARELLTYDPETGIFHWRQQRNGYVKAGDVAGGLSAEGYVIIMVDNRSYKASRLAYLMMTGRWPEFDIDHRDLNRSNNKWSNLRVATDRQNAFNKPLRKDNKMGVKGVYPHDNGRYRARIRIDGVLTCLGIFPTKEDAAEAYRSAAIRHHGEFYRAA